MDLIRKERNELLQEEKNDELQKIKTNLQTQTDQDLNLQSIHLMKASNSKTNTNKTNESEYLQIQFDFFTKFIDWIQTESKNLLTSTGNFSHFSTLIESNTLDDSTDQTSTISNMKDFNLKETTRNINNINFGTSRRSIGFETLSTPTKNLILALGDVQLQKSLKEEHYLKEFFKCICNQSLLAYTVFHACRTSIHDMKKSSNNKKNDVESNICSELFSTNEYISVLSKINTIESILNDVLDDTTATKELQNQKDDTKELQNQSLNTLLITHTTYCEKLRNCTEKLETIAKLLDNKNKENTIQIRHSKNSLNSFKEIDERLKLRLKKNEISKQKLVELSKSSTSSSNLSKVLETLRLAETEIDDQIEKLSFIIQESCQTPLQKQKEDKQYDQAKDIKIQMKETDLLNLKTMIDECSLTLSCITVKIKLLKSIVNMEIEEEIKKYQIELNERIYKKCLQIKEQVYETFQFQKKMYLEDLLSVHRSETTLKNELQNLLKIVRNDSRGVDQCLRSMTTMSTVRSEKINFESLHHYKMFLESGDFFKSL
jgi:hypothetical protein